MTATPGTRAVGAPLVSVVRGEPTAEELAALVAVLTAVARRGAEAGHRPAPAAAGSPRATAPWTRRTAAPRGRWCPGPAAVRAPWRSIAD